ncbi:MAG: ABC transporter permease [Oscillospiraceae bacterium]
MEGASFGRQTAVYFRKVARIAMTEKVWKYVVFSVIISFLVAAVVGDKMFDTMESTKSGFFTIASACIWIGIFNSIQSICKEHDTIREEYRAGARLSSYVTANVLWQIVISLVQSAIILGVCMVFIDFNTDGVILPALVEYFITIFLLVSGADILGIMISSIAGTATTAMTIMPFVLILQLIMSGVLFELDGWSEMIAYITFSKWGMGAFGSIADLNGEHLPMKINETLKADFGFEIPHANEECYENTPENLLICWGCCAAVSLACYFISIICLKIKNRGS